MALRLVLAGREPADEAVRRLRALAGVARACRTGDRSGLRAIFERDRALLRELPAGGESSGEASADLGRAARAAYEREVAR